MIDLDQPYGRAKLILIIFGVVFFVYAGASEIEGVGEDEEPTFEEHPITSTFVLIWGLLLVFGLPVAGYYIGKDKKRLKQRFDNVRYWHWLLTIILIYFTLGLYGAYYAYTRRQVVGQIGDAKETYKQARESAKSSFETAISFANEGAFTRAINEGEQALQDAGRAREYAMKAAVTDDELPDLRADIRSALAEWELERVDRKMSTAAEAAEKGDYEHAVEVSGAAVDDLRDQQWNAESKENELEAMIERAERARFEWIGEYVDELCDQAEDYVQTREFGEAQNAVEKAQSLIDEITEISAAESSMIADYKQKVRRQQLTVYESHAESCLEQADESAAEENYEAALDALQQASENLETALAYGEDLELDTDSLEVLLETVTERSSECERDALVSRINEAMAADPDEFERASRDVRDVLNALPEADVLSAQEKALVREEARNAYVTTRTEGADYLLEVSIEYLEDNEYEQARETIEEVIDVIEETVATAEDWEETQREELVDLRRRAENMYVDTFVESIESMIETGSEQFEASEYDRAKESFAEASDRAGQPREKLTDEEAIERLTQLREIAENNVEAAQRASLGIGSDKPPLRHPSEADDSHEQPATDSTADPTFDSRRKANGAGPPPEVPRAPEFEIEYGALDRGESIGRGGNADVYRADVTLNGSTQTIALKEPRFQSTVGRQVVKEFVNEAETWEKLDDHDNIVGVVDWSTEPLPWIAMEYMDGGDLSQRFEEVELPEAVWIARSVTEGVLHAHRRGVAHLDLKPENILFRESSEDHWDVPKVGDWGLAKMLLDHSKSIEGVTPRYAAPEQFDDEQAVNQLTDVYQLGAVFYELFTGEPPFSGSPIEVVKKITEDTIRPPTEVDPSLPDELDDILFDALEKDPANRYEDLLYLRDELDEIGNKI